MLLEYAISFLGWGLLPNLATRFVLGAYHGFAYRSNNRPRVGTPLYFKHYRRAHVTLIIGYLLFTVYSTYDLIRKNGDFYQALGVDLDATEKQVKSRFRRLAAQYHPDKQIFGDPETSEVAFMALKSAQDLLINPVNRFIYDKFGPQILSWPHSATIKEYLATAFRMQWPFYFGSVISMFGIRATGYLRGGMIWRLFAFANLALLEMYIVTRPELPFLSNYVNPVLSRLPLGRSILPFQFLELMRKLTISGLIAMSQLEPYLRVGGGDDVENIDQRLAKVEFLGTQISRCADDMLKQQTAPFTNNETALQSLEHNIAERIVHNTLLSDPLVRKALVEVKRSRDELQNLG